MKTCQIALKKIQDYFATVGVTIIVTPIEEFSNPTGWFGPNGKLAEEWSVKRPNRYVLEVSDEVAIGFLIHEALHTVTARPAWDHTFSGCTYNWTSKGTLFCEEFPIVVYGRNIIQVLDIQAAATASAAIWKDPDNIGRNAEKWKQPGGDLLSHDSMGWPEEKRVTKALVYLTLIGVTDTQGTLIGRFDPNISNNKIKKIKVILKTDDVMGLVPQVGSPIQKRKLAA